MACKFALDFAISLSKSHTVYGLRGGALVSIHPDESVVERHGNGRTGRQTWSASSRLAQYSIAKIHSNSESGAAWSDEKLRLTKILQERRDLFIAK